MKAAEPEPEGAAEEAAAAGADGPAELLLVARLLRFDGGGAAAESAGCAAAAGGGASVGCGGGCDCTRLILRWSLLVYSSCEDASLQMVASNCDTISRSLSWSFDHGKRALNIF